MSIKKYICSKIRHYQYKSVPTSQSAVPVKITYLCQNTLKPSGGVKVIYKHTSIINSRLSDKAFAQILHANQLGFRCKWGFDNLRFKQNYCFDSSNEIFILHEMWAVRESKVLIQKNIKYGIFVQGGYLINRKANFDEIKLAYEAALVVICVSEDIYQCLVHLFPHLSDKITRVHVSVDSDVFRSNSEKKNLITYMPRRLKRHAELVLLFLKPYLPPNWEIRAIDRMTESEVAQNLSESKIFLSFSELEGLGLPPIEAALSGNVVIGYSGEGGKEYWHNPLFLEVSSGNIRDFAKSVLRVIHQYDTNLIKLENLRPHINELASKYSASNEVRDLDALLVYIKDKFASIN